MKATKIKLVVHVEVLSVDSIPGLLAEIAGEIRNENESGHFDKNDGDCIMWELTKKEVEF